MQWKVLLMKNSSNSISTNVLWRLAERFGAQGVSFVVSVVLARIISPEAYGTVALITVIINIMNVFVQSGLSTALIQKREADDLDFTTVFVFNIFMSIALYFLFFFLAPAVAAFYDKPDMVPIIRVLSLSVILGGINGIQQAYISKRMQFQLFFKATIGGTVCSAFAGIAMAYSGLGVWALVGQILTNQIMDTVILWLMLEWHPSFRFSLERFKPLYSFGWKVFFSNLIDTLYKNLRSLLIGKVYTEADLAFYNRGNRLPELVITNVNTSIQSVFFPAYSAANGNKMGLKSLVRKSIASSTYLIFPCMMGLAVVSENLISILYTDVWMEAVPYMWIGCFSYVFWPLHTANLQVIQAMGRSDIILKIEILKKAVTVICLIWMIQYGVFAVAVCAIPLAVFSLLVNAYPNSKLLDYSIKEQFLDLFPALWMSLVMGICVYLAGLFPLAQIPKLIVQIIAGVFVYISLSALTKNSSYCYVKRRAKDMITGVFNRR
ncbi:MAG: lipopolysaccharide biosynthesis protein [Eubacteriales bacterium]|nr:lipopolysaccharide biosynthesis protein [Eubacteriales bacterium]